MLHWISILGGLLIMMGQHDRSEALFYYFRLEDQVPEHHLLLCSAESRCDLTQQFLRANIHGATRREHLALLSGNRLATHGDGYLGTAAACCRNPECLVPSSREVVPDCSGQPTPARSSEDASRSTGSRNPDIHGGSFPSAVHSKHWPLAPARVFVELSARMPPTHRQLLPKRSNPDHESGIGRCDRSGWLLETAARSRRQSDGP